MKPALSIIVVSYNTKALLEKCLASLKTAAGSLSCEIIVVDNASSDGSAEMVRKKFSRAKLIRSSFNLGFGAANNQGIAASSGKYLALVNSDAFPEPCSLEKSVRFMESQKRAAAVSLALFNPDGSAQPNCTTFPTLESELLARIPFFSVPAKYYAPESPSEVENFSGACFVLRKSAVEQCGAFDESFFMYLEESDLFMRLSRAGWKIFYMPAGRAVHFGGASTSYAPRRHLLYFKSLLRLFSKHYGVLHSLALRATVFTSSALLLLASPVRLIMGAGRAKDDFDAASGLLWQSVSSW